MRSVYYVPHERAGREGQIMANCPSCNADVLVGSRWCGICRTNVVNPEIGRLASPGKRLGAYVLDLLVPIVALFLILFIVGLGASTGSDEGMTAGGLLGFLMLVAYGVWALVLFSRGTTPGKNALGMRVIKEDGTHAGFLTMLVREWIGKWISGLIFALGFLWILFDRDNQGWHDKLVNTYVVG